MAFAKRDLARLLEGDERRRWLGEALTVLRAHGADEVDALEAELAR